MLQSLQGVSDADVLKAKAYINLEDINKSGGYAGCNRMFFTTKTGTNRSIGFTNIGATKMYCEAFMHVENNFAKALEKVNTYEITGRQIKFKDSSGKTIIEAVAAAE